MSNFTQRKYFGLLQVKRQTPITHLHKHTTTYSPSVKTPYHIKTRPRIHVTIKGLEFPHFKDNYISTY